MRTEEKKIRNREIDIMKGLLTTAMILCHCIQFFGDESLGVSGILVNVINLTAFSGFLYCFGYVGTLAYYRKPFGKAVGKMMKNVLRMLAAFYLSGIAYTAFAERKAYTAKRVTDILMLRVYPGWSEFLASFAAVLLVGIVLFPLMKRMNGRIFAMMLTVSFAGCFLPYDRIHHSWPALMVGSWDFITFPVLQYWIFYAAGVWNGRTGVGWKDRRLCIGAIAAGGVFAVYCKTVGFPQRFPPSVWFLCGGIFAVYVCRQISFGLKALTERSRLCGGCMNAVEQVGKNSLFYLLGSNFIIFALNGSKFKYPSELFAYVVFLIVMVVLWYLRRMIR